MNSPPIQRFSSRTHRLDQTVLTKYLKQAKRYHRIAGYFTSSLFEIAGEHLDGIEDVRIVCNSDVRSEDIKVAKIQESKLLGRLNSLPVEAESLLNRPRYKWLYEFLDKHPNAIRVAPDDFCGFVHGKAGVIELHDGRQIGFMGSMNETRAGWQSHYEIVWSDESPEGVAWIQAEFDALWAKAVPLPRAVVQEVGRRAHRVEIELGDQPDEESLAPAALVESPMYREGLSLSPWQRAFVAECMKHLRWHGVVRLLLADEVGLGKTLALATAALTLTLVHEQEIAQRGARGRRRPIVIFAPAPLTEQWQTELLDKLGLPCARWSSQKKVWLDPEDRAISPTGAENVTRCPLRIGIISTGLIVQPTRERDLLSQLNFEILIQDESHKSRSKQGMGKDAGEPNALLKFMLAAAGRSRHVLLGTATPMQTQVEDLWDQLKILHQGDGRFVMGNELSPWHYPEQVVPVVTGESHIGDLEEAWRYLRSPLPPLDSSAESDFRRVIHEIRGELGMPPKDFDTAAPIVNLPYAVRDDLEDLLDTERANMRFFQRHNPIVRHVVLRKRKVLEDAGLLEKVGVDLHPNQEKCRDPNTFAILFQRRALRTDQAFLNAYEAAQTFGRIYGRRAGAGFMKNLVEQRLCSSCVAGLNTAQQLLNKQAAEDENEQESVQDIELAIAEQEALHDLINALKEMQEEDPKLKAVKHYLTQENWVQHGCIIFSQYYDTAAWVAENLAALFPNQLIGLYAGADKSALFRGPENSNRAKRETLKKMVEEQAIRIMVATDAACEGLNLQRLGTLINVDLPWNPTRLEQRIGRIKRFGQTRPTVDMLNLVYQDTVDETIYERLSERMRDRFDLFGSLPDTIEDTWIKNIETLDEKLDEYINAQKRVNGFDIRYNANLDAEEDEWRNCARVLSRRSIETLMRNGW
ncbi:phospholipase D-like domain-containing anti-phage protein [Halomicronema sp. CCY15110]|uniref:phospholipase D-like domain-containing anti-phage protein n=1 Tax=Halomicronema sp. CCY15110 TaxID=2767773 RepID=UPI001952695B|nr:phospholipase D-like domain-containing anti-phage protein [Halomicronema sp. CCY15110]